MAILKHLKIIFIFLQNDLPLFRFLISPFPVVPSPGKVGEKRC